MIAETTERAVKERPIIFTGEMVRAILEGKKTQTRRIVKLPKRSTDEWSDFELDDHDLPMVIASNTGCFSHIGCPYGMPGDRLYVREAFETKGYGAWELGIGMPEFEVRYPANGEAAYFIEGTDDRGKYALRRWKRRPSIHMPKFLSRIKLELVSVRVERVQEITGEDILSEGVEPYPLEIMRPLRSDLEFAELWDRINKGRGYGWDVNPWCWVLTFKRLDS